MISKFVSEVFYRPEILNTEKFFKFIGRKKMVVYVPPDHIRNITSELSAAGAGSIGNYEMCSFRTPGTGTFKPNKKARPFTGKKNIFTETEEFRLEMEFDTMNLNKVIDALLSIHPYDEPAYEIYDFKKREKNEIGIIVNLKSKMKYSDFIKRLNRNLTEDVNLLQNDFKKIAFINSDVDEIIYQSAVFTNCECLLSNTKKNYKLIKIQ